jgi:peptidoglycan/xylan/chitin deacetylase (PgdA/CDA1 family)
MKKWIAQRTRNGVLLVLICTVGASLLIFGAAAGIRALAAFAGPARAVSASAPISASSHSVISTLPSAVLSSSGASSAPVSSDAPSQTETVSKPASRPESVPSSSPGSVGTQSRAGKTVYLTFDDGPSTLTVPLLDVLDRYHVKATFFVVGVNDKNETHDLKEIVRRGHAVGVHSWSHNYRQIYASPEAFFSDYDRMHHMILETTGVDTKICRLPGGSVNAYNAKTREAIFRGLKQRGFVYYDWNAAGGDAEGKMTSGAILHSALNGVHAHGTSVVLFHNTTAKKATLRQMPEFLETLKREGYTFATLDPSVNNAPYIF